MSEDVIGYSKLIDTALRGVVRDALKTAQNQTLPGEHHFYITFKTDYPGVLIAEHIKGKYPDEMTIVLQHQFWNLKVEEKLFSVVLSFNKIREKLVIPYHAITAFVDPSIKFGLQLQAPHNTNIQAQAEQLEFAQVDDIPARSADIISLDAFRKK